MTLTNVTVPFCNNCSAAISAFTGATGSAALINPAIPGTLVMKFRGFYDANGNGHIDAGECPGDWIIYTITINPLPACSVTGAATVCPSSVGNVYNATAGMSGYSWSITGAGSIVGSTTGPSVSVTAAANCNSSYTVAVTITNANGCQSTCSKVVTVKDIQGPTITGCPSNQVRNNTLLCTYKASGAEFNISGATDNCGGPVMLSYQLSGATNSGVVIASTLNNVYFNLGVTTVTWKATDVCGNPSTCVFTVTVSDVLNTTGYIIYAQKEAKFGEENDINGDVGVTDANGKAEFKKNTSLDPFFVKAKNISVQMPATVNNKFFVPATGGPNPFFMIYSGGGLSGNYTQASNGIVPAGNYKNLTIKKGVTATVNGNNYGKIKIEEGANVTFTSSSINMEELEVGKGKKSVNTTNVYFSNPTSVMVKDRVTIEEDCNINVGGPNVTFYLGDAKKDEENFIVKGDNSTVTLNIMIPNGKLKVTGGARNSTMNGWFIVEKVESDGRGTTWNKYDCGLPRGSIVTQAESKVAPVVEKGIFTIKAYPNPSNSQFVLQVNSASNEPVTIRIFDAAGKTHQLMSNVPANSVKLFGSELHQGIYFAEVLQGEHRETIKLLKVQ